MSPVEVRCQITERLRRDLIGPHEKDEVLEGERVRPSDVYLTGVLWPLGERMGAEEDDGAEGDDEADDVPSTSTPVGQQRPCTMGISFCVAETAGPASVDIEIEFATYRHEALTPPRHRWTREPHRICLKSYELPESSEKSHLLSAANLEATVDLHVRTRRSSVGTLVTVTLINRSTPPREERNVGESLTLFQTRMRITPAGDTRIIPRPQRLVANDADERVARLLYRNSPEFATGHQCSASWQSTGVEAQEVTTEWIPETPVIAFREDGHDVFAGLVASGAFQAERLSRLEDDLLLAQLKKLPEAYGEWIKLKQGEAEGLAESLRPIASSHLQVCADVMRRMETGIDAMAADRELLGSFRLANAAMALQHSWKTSAGRGPLCWRPFQLGFILLAAESVCKPDAHGRDILDLLWFPTGGGKTEAYLALVAMLAFHRRTLHTNPDAGAGNAAVMRYTLRLLTAQQFERATSLILACELIRRNRVAGMPFDRDAGNVPFSIGLWVGGDATPNSFKDALASRSNRDGTSAEQIDSCPCCQGPVRWHYDERASSVQPYCESQSCSLGPGFGSWPVFTVDEDIYRQRPTLLIGTIDKFALLPTRAEVADLFGFGTDQSPDLIIQDELHLISGPLGTIAGIYEVAFDWLLRKGQRRAKIIGSTATIRRAADQVRALFDRESCQFPPPGIDHDDSGFAVKDLTKPARLYLAVTTAGRSAKFALQATAGSLLQSCGDTVGLSDQSRDGYSTLLAYFNSLRELGGAIVQMLDDVPDSMRLYATQREEDVRLMAPPRELTSRVSQKEILEILNELKIKAGNAGSVDVVLATNMVSVGVDVSRLGLMVVNGQPKTRSEYIQATSRVGRSVFPGIVVSVLNAAKPRDRSHYETFVGWHSSLYRDVEATSVTPFASRARDRALHAALVAMIRHGDPAMRSRPDLGAAPDSLLAHVVAEIERRVSSVDERELRACSSEVDERLGNWDARKPVAYNNRWKPNESLLISADLNAQRRAAGRLPPAAWPTMNNMRSVEASTRFRMAEVLRPRGGRPSDQTAGTTQKPVPRWRKTSG
ncbi:helicase-related protein [Novilysobacter defluvii]|uniref:helicase-related protein n=1 Tax=Novilysobacter defluvii TaxID=391738 RepID=UPI0009DBD0E3|nr:helicase-related protein [Lysobacter defluvii]